MHDTVYYTIKLLLPICHYMHAFNRTGIVLDIFLHGISLRG